MAFLRNRFGNFETSSETSFALPASCLQRFYYNKLTSTSQNPVSRIVSSQSLSLSISTRFLRRTIVFKLWNQMSELKQSVQRIAASLEACDCLSELANTKNRFALKKEEAGSLWYLAANYTAQTFPENWDQFCAW